MDPFIVADDNILFNVHSTSASSIRELTKTTPKQSQQSETIQGHELYNDNPRFLKSNNDGSIQASMFVDSKGNVHEPYSLAWRYLGVYMDCNPSDFQSNTMLADSQRDLQVEYDDDDYEFVIRDQKQQERKLFHDDEGQCQRKLLWAAYANPKYKIGEYKFYDASTQTWNSTLCQSSSCTKMNCHDVHSPWKLVGVYKESADSMYTWFHQLFIQQGQSIWKNESVYNAMISHVERWPVGCTELGVRDNNGSILYKDIKPLPGGNITVGVYVDNRCSRESPYVTWSDYIGFYYDQGYANFYIDGGGQALAKLWAGFVSAWNDHMTVFTYCQPCRMNGMQQLDYDQHYNETKSNDEMLGYNGYKDTGYTNINVCSIFETDTNIAFASPEVDLNYATQQKSVLGIMVNGKWYGSGSPKSTKGTLRQRSTEALEIVAGTAVTYGLVMTLLLIAWHRVKKRNTGIRKQVDAHSCAANDKLDPDAALNDTVEEEMMSADPIRRDG